MSVGFTMAKNILDMFEENTHTIEIRESPAREWLIGKGYIAWHPPIFGSNNQYMITAEGKAFKERSRGGI